MSHHVCVEFPHLHSVDSPSFSTIQQSRHYCRSVRFLHTSRDLEFDENVPRLVTTVAINLMKKQSELLCYEYLFYINTQAQMLKCFNSLLIQKFTVSAQGTAYHNFFPAHCTCVNFLGDDGLVQGFLSYAYLLAGYFFFKITPPPKVKWLAPNKLALHFQ